MTMNAFSASKKKNEILKIGLNAFFRLALLEQQRK